MILEAHGAPAGTVRDKKYSLFEKVGKAELIEGRAYFDALGGVRVNPYKNPAAQLTPEVRSGDEILYIFGHAGSDLLNGEDAKTWVARLKRMGLRVGDRCFIDITACYAGDAPDGFAATLTRLLFKEVIQAEVIATVGHHQATAGGTKIFDTRADRFYSALWQAAGYNDSGAQFLKNEAIGLADFFVVEFGQQVAARVYGAFLDELDSLHDPVLGVGINIALMQVASIGDPMQKCDEATVFVKNFLFQGPESFSSRFISCLKAYVGGRGQSMAVDTARLRIKAEADRVWQAQKAIIENLTPGVHPHTRALGTPPLPPARLAYSTFDMDRAKDICDTVLECYEKSDLVNAKRQFRNEGKFKIDNLFKAYPYISGWDLPEVSFESKGGISFVRMAYRVRASTRKGIKPFQLIFLVNDIGNAWQIYDMVQTA